MQTVLFVVFCCFPCSRFASCVACCSGLRLLYVVLVVQVVFPISARRLSNDGQLFLKKLPQKLFFVVSLAAGLSELRLLYVVLVVQVVFPISARRLSNDGQLFLKCLILIKCGCSCGMNTEKSVPLSERNKVLRLWQH